MVIRSFVTVGVIVGALACSLAVPASAQLALREKVSTTQEIVVTANPLATAAGVRVLGEGGNAVDAAIAVQAMLGLVEPQATGIGGGGFLVHFDAQTRAVRTWDAREMAPAGADGAYFLGADGKPRGFNEAVNSGRSVGVPGIPALWEAVKPLGALPLAQSLAPAAEAAEAGFAMSPRLAAAVDASKAFLAYDAAARAYFLQPDGAGKPAGTVLRNPGYAAVLRGIASGGAQSFYAGPVAEALVAAVRSTTR